MLYFSLEPYKTVFHPPRLKPSPKNDPPPRARSSIHNPRAQISSRDHLHSWNRIRKNKPIVSAAPRDRLETPCKCDLTLPRLQQECTRGRMKSGRGETFPCKWNAKSSTVCVCVCICRSSWELRRSVSTTTKVPTKGFPISFNGALIATEGMEQPDEREREGGEKDPSLGRRGRKEKEGDSTR